MSRRGTWAAELFPNEQRPRAHSGDGKTHRLLLKAQEGTPGPLMAHWTLAQAQSLAPPCRALSSALLSQTPWQISLGESKASFPQSRVLHSFFTKDVSSPRILILFTSSHVYRVPTAPWHVLRCPSLHYRSVSSRPPSPFYLERT